MLILCIEIGIVLVLHLGFSSKYLLKIKISISFSYIKLKSRFFGIWDWAFPEIIKEGFVLLQLFEENQKFTWATKMLNIQVQSVLLVYLTYISCFLSITDILESGWYSVDVDFLTAEKTILFTIHTGTYLCNHIHVRITIQSSKVNNV
jgi:hypothetical protein